jgi:hypothetical protein
MADCQRLIHRTMNVAASQYEKDLARALLGVLGRGIHDLPGIVAGLNGSDVRPEDAAAWTEQNFIATVERLGAYPNSIGAPLGAHKPGAEPPGMPITEASKRGDHG